MAQPPAGPKLPNALLHSCPRIGLAGLPPLRDDRGKLDRHGYLLHATVLADADAMAAASGLVKGKAEGVPVAVVRGMPVSGETGRARDVLRPPGEDLFR